MNILFWRKKETRVFVKKVDVFSKDRESKIVNEWATINLYETSSGIRSYELVGAWASSPAALSVRAAVFAWMEGGPLPDGMILDSHSAPPKPRKPSPNIKGKAQSKDVIGNVVVFPNCKSA